MLILTTFITVGAYLSGYLTTVVVFSLVVYLADKTSLELKPELNSYVDYLYRWLILIVTIMLPLGSLLLGWDFIAEVLAPWAIALNFNPTFAFAIILSGAFFGSLDRLHMYPLLDSIDTISRQILAVIVLQATTIIILVTSFVTCDLLTTLAVDDIERHALVKLTRSLLFFVLARSMLLLVWEKVFIPLKSSDERATES